MAASTPNRWRIAVAGVVMQIALGAVYAWSVFRIPLTKTFAWTIPQVTLTFTIAIFVLGFAAFAGGIWMRRSGPRVVALTAGVLYGLGVFLASLTDGRLWWLYGSYGVIGGVGLGLGYIVPVATLVKWFPDKRGLITGVAVTGFGSGALITAPIATRLIASVGTLQTFAILGAAYFVTVVSTALFMQNPPAGYRPDGWTPIRRTAAGPAPLRLRRSDPHVAVVRALAAVVPQYHRGDRDHFAGGADGAGNHQCRRRTGGESGRHHLDRQRRGTVALGVVVGCDRQANGVS